MIALSSGDVSQDVVTGDGPTEDGQVRRVQLGVSFGKRSAFRLRNK